MHPHHLFTTLLSTLNLTHATQPPSPSSYLRATALITTPANTSALQCWEFTQPLARAAESGTQGALALPLLHATAAENITYSVLPPRFDGGLHVAPRMQFVVFTSGLAHISLPASPAEAWVLGGSGAGLLVAADTRGSGHYTRYPSDQSTVALQIPFAAGDVPGHRVVNETAACVGSGVGQVVEHA